MSNRRQRREVFQKGGEFSEDVTHTCGHVCRYEFVDPLPTVQGGLRKIAEKPCLWCGPDHGVPVPHNVAHVVIPTPHASIMAVYSPFLESPLSSDPPATLGE